MSSLDYCHPCFFPSVHFPRLALPAFPPGGMLSPSPYLAPRPQTLAQPPPWRPGFSTCPAVIHPQLYQGGLLKGRSIIFSGRTEANEKRVRQRLTDQFRGSCKKHRRVSRAATGMDKEGRTREFFKGVIY